MENGHKGLLLFTPLPWKSQNGAKIIMDCCCLPPDRVKLAVNSKKETNSRVKMGKGSRWASVIYPLKDSKWGCCCLPPDRVKLIVNNKKKQTAGSKWAKSQNGSRVKMGFCSLPPDRVKPAVNSKKSKQQGQNGPRWASVIYPLKESKCAAAVYPLTESN